MQFTWKNEDLFLALISPPGHPLAVIVAGVTSPRLGLMVLLSLDLSAVGWSEIPDKPPEFVTGPTLWYLMTKYRSVKTDKAAAMRMRTAHSGNTPDHLPAKQSTGQ